MFKINDEAGKDKDRLQQVLEPAILCFSFSLVIGATLWFFRLPLDVYSTEIFSYLGLSALAIFAPIIVNYYMKIAVKKSVSFLVASTFSMITFPSLTGDRFGIYGPYILIILGIFCFLWGGLIYSQLHLKKFNYFLFIRNSIFLIVVLLLLSATVTIQNKAFLFFDALSVLGNSDSDQYSFIAMTNMLGNFSEISNGVDGFSYIKVHFLTELFLGRTAVFFGGLTEHSVVYFGCIVCLPVLSYLYILFIREIFESNGSVLLIFVSIWVAQWTFQLIEPKYLLWRVLPRFLSVLFSIPYLFFIVKKVFDGVASEIKPLEVLAYNIGNIILILFHPGVGFVFSFVSTYVLFRYCLKRPLYCAFVTMGTLSVAIITVFQVTEVSWLVFNEATNWEPDTSGYMTLYHSGRYFQLITYYVMPIYYIGSRITEIYPVSRQSICDGIVEYKFVDIEIVIFMYLMFLFFEITPHAVWPVSILTAQVFWMVPFLIGRAFRNSAMNEFYVTVWGGKKDSVIIPIFLLLFALWIQRFTIEFQNNRDQFTKSLHLISKHLYFKNTLVGGYWELGKYSLSDYEHFKFQPSSERSKLIGHLKEVKNRLGNNLIFYFPVDNRNFWNLERKCASQALLIPATIGTPVLDGMPPLWRNCSEDRSILNEYGFPQISRRESDKVLNDKTLCLRAKREGITQVYKVDFSDDSFRGREIRCSRLKAD